MPLSQYNKYEVCFAHDEHPEKQDREEIDHDPPIGAGHQNTAVNITIMNEYGVDGFN